MPRRLTALLCRALLLALIAPLTAMAQERLANLTPSGRGDVVTPRIVYTKDLPEAVRGEAAAKGTEVAEDAEGEEGLLVPGGREEYERRLATQIVPTVDQFAHFSEATTPLDKAAPLAPSQLLGRGRGRQFSGIGANGSVPGEPTVAVGRGYVLQTANTSIRVYSVDGVLKRTFNTAALFNTSDGQRTFDMQAVYDPIRKRFVISAQTSNYFYFAISADSVSSPDVSAFYVYEYRHRGNNGTSFINWGDFPKIGLTDDKLALTLRYYNEAGTVWVDTRIWVFDRASMYAGLPTASYWRSVQATWPVAWFSPNETFGLAPAINLTGGEQLELLSTDPFNHHAVLHITLSGPASATLFAKRMGVAISPYSIPPAAPQRATNGVKSISDLDCRIGSQIYNVNGVLTASFMTGGSIGGNVVGMARVLVYRAHPDAVLLDAAYGAADRHIMFPAAYTDPMGNTFMGYTVASPNIYTTHGCAFRGASEMDFSGGGLLENAPPVTVSTLSNRWGDYTGIAPGDVLGDRSTAWYTGLRVDPFAGWSSTISEIMLPQAQISGRIGEDCDGDPATTADFHGTSVQDVYLYRGRNIPTGECSLLQATKTDAQGRWRFSSLPGGDYTVIPRYGADPCNFFSGESSPWFRGTYPGPGLRNPEEIAVTWSDDSPRGLAFTLAETDSVDGNTFLDAHYAIQSVATAPATITPLLTNHASCTQTNYDFTAGLAANARESGYVGTLLYWNTVPAENSLHLAGSSLASIGNPKLHTIEARPTDGVWGTAGKPDFPGSNDCGCALPSFAYAGPRGDLYAVRRFTDNDYTRLFVRDSLAWRSLGSTSLDMHVVAEAASGRLYFSGVPGTPYDVFNDVASYSPTTNLFSYNRASDVWAPVLQGTNGTVHAILPMGNEIVFGGEFTAATGYGTSANRIIKYNETTGGWVAMGTGLNGPVSDLAKDDAGNIYAVGSFTQAGGLSAYGAAMWSPSLGWVGMYGGATGAYRHVVVARGVVYVAASHGGPPTSTGHYVAKWVRGGWQTIASPNGEIDEMTVDAQGRVVIAGAFTSLRDSAGATIPAARIAAYDADDLNARWLAVGTGSLDAGAAIASIAFAGNRALAVGANMGAVGGTLNDGYVLANLAQASTTTMTIAATQVAYGAPITVDAAVQSSPVAVGRVDLYDGNKRIATTTLSSKERATFVVNLREGVYRLRVEYAGCSAVAASVSAPITVTVAAPSVVSGDELWDDRFYGSGLTFTALTTSATGGRLAAAVARDAFVNCPVYSWNGTTWSMLGRGANDRVNALALTASGTAYAAGEFTRIGGVDANFVARWTGTTWAPLGAGLNGPVHAMGVDGSGNLYVAGAFTTADGRSARNIARWNGTRWDSLGTGLPNIVRSLLVRPTGAIYAGGDGGGSKGCVAIWDGGIWNTLGTSGLDPRISVKAMTFDAGGALCAAFNGSMPPYRYPTVAKWSGSAWVPLQGAVDRTEGNPVLNEIRALATDAAGRILAGGLPSYPTNYIDLLTDYPRTRISTVEAWDGSAWTSINGPEFWWEFDSFNTVIGYNANRAHEVNALAADASSRILETGNIPGNIHVSETALYEGPGAGPVSNNLKDLAHQSTLSVEGIVSLARESNGGLLATGGFTQIGGVNANSIARRSGTIWSPLDQVSDERYEWGDNSSVRVALGAGKSWLIARCSHTYSRLFGATTKHYYFKVYALSGTTWQYTTEFGAPLGFDYGGPVGVFSRLGGMIVSPSGDLVVSGDMSADGNIYQYRSGGGAGLGRGLHLNSGASGLATALCYDRNGNLFAGGDFDSAGTVVARNLARWNGTDWQAVGGGVNGSVTALATDALNRLYVAGTFDSVGGVPARHLARWNGSSWTAIGGTGVQGSVTRMTFDATGNLYIAGSFTEVSGVPAANIAKWDGSQWRAMGSGVDGPVSAMVMDSTSSLYVGGSFRMSGGKLASGLARYTGVGTAVTAVGDGEESGPIAGGLRFGLPSPNPSRGVTSMSYRLSRPGVVRLDVYEIAGRRVKRIEASRAVAGPGVLEWDGRDAEGHLMPAGLYLFTATAEGVQKSRRVVLIR